MTIGIETGLAGSSQNTESIPELTVETTFADDNTLFEENKDTIVSKDDILNTAE